MSNHRVKPLISIATTFFIVFILFVSGCSLKSNSTILSKKKEPIISGRFFVIDFIRKGGGRDKKYVLDVFLIKKSDTIRRYSSTNELFLFDKIDPGKYVISVLYNYHNRKLDFEPLIIDIKKGNHYYVSTYGITTYEKAVTGTWCIYEEEGSQENNQKAVIRLTLADSAFINTDARFFLSINDRLVVEKENSKEIDFSNHPLILQRDPGFFDLKVIVETNQRYYSPLYINIPVLRNTLTEIIIDDFKINPIPTDGILLSEQPYQFFHYKLFTECSK